jgi:hypothetical protein
LIWSGSATGLIEQKFAGAPVEALMHGVDWLPTICKVAGVPDCGSSGLPLDGMEMTGPLFSNSSGGHAFVLYGQHDDAPDRYTPYDDAIRDAEGWKLIQGWGGKPSDWSSSPPNMSHAQQCTMPNCFGSDEDPLELWRGGLAADAVLPLAGSVDCTGAKTQNCCYPNNDIVTHGLKNATTVAECCAACAANHVCVGWTLNKQNAACFLKHKMENPKCGGHCVSGGALLPPAPPGPPPPPEGGVMLFNVVSDPGEHDEVSAANPDIVKRLSAELDKMRESAVVFHDKLTCTGPATKTTPQGQVAVPNCVQGGPDV